MLKDARIAAGLTVRALARDVGVTPAAISRYENGLRIPKRPIAVRIAERLGVNWYDL